MTPIYLDTPGGKLAIGATKDALVLCDWVNSPHFAKHLNILDSLEMDSSYCAVVVEHIKEYFSGTRTEFDITVAPVGTEFQQKIWKALQDIEFGTTISYSEFAKSLGMPKAARSIAGAIAQNPISIVIPCHRVIGADGSLTGYAGGIPTKRFLLTHESPTNLLHLSTHYFLP